MCPICSQCLVNTGEVVPNYTFTSSAEVLLCSGCGLKNGLVRHDAEPDYEAIYEDVTSDPSYKRYLSYANEVKRKKDPLKWLSKQEPAYFAVREAVLGALVPDSKILEIGSGFGYLTYALNESNYDCTGIDLSAEAVNFANAEFGTFFSNLDVMTLMEDKKYDCIVATEVIEHLLDPSEFVKKLKTLVKPDGCIILTTPNKSFFPDSVVWESSLPPIHHWWLTEKSLSVLSEKIGMGVKFTDFSKRYGIWNTQVWNVNNLDIAYQGADQSIATKISFGQVARRKTKNFLTSLPILMFLATKTMEMLKVRKYIYAGSKCHCMGVILNTHVPD